MDLGTGVRRKVYIISSLSDAYALMFHNNGYDVTTDISEANLICFTGGADVHPSFYGEVKEPETVCDVARDAREADLFLSNPKVPMVGICRGGQFLNVMCGGSLVQHVDEHQLGFEGSHLALNLDGGEEVVVTSTHHQRIIMGDDAELLLYGPSSDDAEVEACYYEGDNVLCFQPHPEFSTADRSCVETFFSYIDDYLFDEGEEVV